MKLFREYIEDETVPFAFTDEKPVSINENPVRDEINIQLAYATAEAMPTPYHALERVRKVLASYHIFLPKTMFLDGISGHETFTVKQFNNVMGAKDNGEITTSVGSPYHVFFEYVMDDNGTFDVFCEIVNDEELEEIMADMEEEDTNDN